jgi:cellobiose phosphorylase
MSYTKISSTRAGVHAETLHYVPLGESLKVWRLRVTNQREAPVDLSIFSSIEFCL